MRSPAPISPIPQHDSCFRLGDVNEAAGDRRGRRAEAGHGTHERAETRILDGARGGELLRAHAGRARAR